LVVEQVIIKLSGFHDDTQIRHEWSLSSLPYKISSSLLLVIKVSKSKCGYGNDSMKIAIYSYIWYDLYFKCWYKLLVYCKV
jgi:hypothetical protein